MSIIKWFNKPKWQSPNEQVRLTAIQSSQDPELTAQLKNLVMHDVSEKVQVTALNKIINFEEINDIINTHPSKKIRNIAKRKLINWFSEKQDDAQLSLVNIIKDKEVIQALAKDANSEQVRKIVIPQINQQGLLSELLLIENNKDIQNILLSQIKNESTILKILEKIKKKNKYHKLRKSLEQKIGTKQDSTSDHALELCQTLESIVHGKVQKSIDLSVIKSQWNEIKSSIPDNIKQRFSGAFEAARMILDPKHREDFLQNQKIQRAVVKINEIKEIINNKKNLSLIEIQELTENLELLDLKLLPESDNQIVIQLKEKLINLREQVQLEQKIPEQAFEVVEQIKHTLNQATANPQQLTQIKTKWQNATKQVKNSEAFNQLSEQFQDHCIQLAEKIEQSANLRDLAAKQAINDIELAIKQIEEGHLAKAKIISNKIAENKRIAGFSHPLIKRHKYQLDQVWNRLKELRDWQKWSNDKIRKDIINDVASMHGQGLHPDAVLKKLKDSNEQWYALEDMEKLEGDKYPSRNQTLWQEFRTVSKAVFEPTQPFFEKRSEQQNSYLDELNALIDEMKECDLENSSERDLARISRSGIKALKSLDQLPPKQRGKIAKKLRKSINRIDNKLNEFYHNAEKHKIKLIEQAQALSEMEDTSEAIEQAKLLQQKWKTAGIVKQYTERKLWKKFRKANDVIFNKRDQKKQEINQAYKQQKEDVKSYLNKCNNQLKELASIEELSLFKSTTTKGWEELEKPKQFMQTELNELLNNVDQKINEIKNESLLEAINNKEKIDRLTSQYEQQELTEEAYKNQLNEFKDENLLLTFKSRNETEYNEDNLKRLMIEAEFLTGLSTPEEHMEQRMAFQVKVLSERMSGNKGMKEHEQANHLLTEWFAQPKSNKKFIQTNSKRIDEIIKALKNLALS